MNKRILCIPACKLLMTHAYKRQMGMVSTLADIWAFLQAYRETSSISRSAFSLTQGLQRSLSHSVSAKNVSRECKAASRKCFQALEMFL
jgi:hypothetical protein